MFRSILIVGIGGAFGASMRYIITVLISKYQFQNIPLATFSANILGCFLVGIFLNIIEKNVATTFDLRLLLVTGFCGSLTTFSALTIEEFSFISGRQFFSLAVYLGASVVFGLIAFWIGSLCLKP